MKNSVHVFQVEDEFQIKRWQYTILGDSRIEDGQLCARSFALHAQ